MSTKELKNVYLHPRYNQRAPESGNSQDLDPYDPSPKGYEDAPTGSHCRGTCTLDVYDEEGARGLDEDIAAILRSKCPVIASARQQIRRLVGESDRIFNDGPGIGNSYRSIWLDLLRVAVRILQDYNTCCCLALVGLLVAFTVGLLLGAASCGTWLRRINSPLLNCINGLLAPDAQGYRSIT